MLVLFSAFAGQAPPAPPCPSEVIASLTQPTPAGAAPFRLTCFATLPQGAAIVRSLLLEGAEASGAGVDCQSGTIGRPSAPSTTTAPTVAIQSRQDAGGWSRPLGVQIVNCTIHGNVRLWGLGGGGRMEELRASSRRPDHTQTVQTAAPSGAVFENVTFMASGSIPLYVGPGVTGVRVRGGGFTGRSVSTAVYLDAESADTTIEGVGFDIRTGREQIAVDGSARNRIVGNRFVLAGRGGIFLYRNCGEDGVIRHQTPSGNQITDNEFTGAAWWHPLTVVIGAREGRRRYCNDDAGYGFGSSLDDRDHATDNIVMRNTVRYRWLPAWFQAGRGAVRAP